MVKKLLFLSSMLFAPMVSANIQKLSIPVLTLHTPTAVEVRPLVFDMDRQMNCMVRTAMAEAENQTATAQAGVMYTILNRAQQRHKSFCSIVNEKSQFSHRKFRWSSKVREIYALADGVISGRIKDVTHGATFFHDDSLKKNPFRKTIKTVKLDNMVFYRATKVVTV